MKLRILAAVAVVAAGVGIGLTVPTTQQQTFRAAAPISPTSCQFNGVQDINITGTPTGGTWNLSLDGGGTTTPTYGVAGSAPSSSTLQTDIAALSGVGSGSVVVSGSSPTYTVTFSGAIYNTVNLFTVTIVSPLTGGTSPKIKAITVPQDQTQDFQKLVNSAGDHSTLTLPPSSCWEIDSQFQAGNVGADMYINDPNVATPAAPFIFGGTNTVGLTNGQTGITQLSVTTSGTVNIPDGTTVALTNSNGVFQSFTTAGNPGGMVTAGATVVKISTATASANFAVGSQFAGFYTQLSFTPSNTISVPSGSHIYLSNASGSHFQTFTTTSITNVGSNIFHVTGLPINFAYGTSIKEIPIPSLTQFTPDGTSPYDLPSGSVITITQDGCATSFCSDTYHTTTDMPPFSTSPVTITGSGGVTPVFPSVPYDTNATIFNTGNFIHINHHTNLTINGNGASIVQTACQPSEVTGGTPILFLTQDTGLTIKDLTITGAINWPHAGCNGGSQDNGPAFEKSAGLILEDEVNMTLTNVGVRNVQGDGLDVYPSQDFGQTTGPMNTNVVVSNSTFDGGGGGYHGLVVEAVGPTASCPNCGAKFIGNTWNQWTTEMMDFEQDAGETSFNTGGGCTSLPSGLCPGSYAQDNILISNNTYSAWCQPWFASLQGSLTGNGIQEQNMTMTNNLLNNTSCLGGGSSSPFMEIDVHPATLQGPSGSPPTTSPAVAPRYWTSNWNVSHNTETGPGGFTATAPVNCSGTPPVGQTSFFQGLVNSTFSDNNFPVSVLNVNPGCPHNPLLLFTHLQATSNITISNNNFSGAFTTAQSNAHTSQENYKQCGNQWGLVGNTHTPQTFDPPC